MPVSPLRPRRSSPAPGSAPLDSDQERCRTQRSGRLATAPRGDVCGLAEEGGGRRGGISPVLRTPPWPRDGRGADGRGAPGPRGGVHPRRHRRAILGVSQSRPSREPLGGPAGGGVGLADSGPLKSLAEPSGVAGLSLKSLKSPETVPEPERPLSCPSRVKKQDSPTLNRLSREPKTPLPLPLQGPLTEGPGKSYQRFGVSTDGVGEP